jgi:glyoxylase-like metal-dependent hydrolase (beta-lactamase superfamily II)
MALGAADPIEDYLAALRLIEGAAGDIDVLVPGHGSIGGADRAHARIDQDRAYVAERLVMAGLGVVSRGFRYMACHP